mgnify:CR=1 FL=1
MTVISAVQAGRGDGQLVAPHGRLPTVSAFSLFSNHHTEDLVGLVGLQAGPAIGIDRHIGGVASVNTVLRVYILGSCQQRCRLAFAVDTVPLETHPPDLFVVCFQRKRKGDRIAADDGADGFSLLYVFELCVSNGINLRTYLQNRGRAYGDVAIHQRIPIVQQGIDGL